MGSNNLGPSISRYVKDTCHLNRYKLYCSDRVLQTNDGLEHGLGVIQYELMGTLLLGWIIVYGIIR